MIITKHPLISISLLSFLTSPSISADIFAFIDEEDTKQPLIASGGHHNEFSNEEIQKLIEKGGKIVNSLSTQNKEVSHKLEVFENYHKFDDGRRKIPLKTYMDPNTPPTNEFLNQPPNQGWTFSSMLSTATSAIPSTLTSFIPSNPLDTYWKDNSSEGCYEESLSSEHTSCESTKDDNRETKTKKFSQSRNRRAFLESNIAIIWKLYDMAYESNQGFVRGAFILEDKNRIIHNFFETYAYEATGTSKDNKLLAPGCYDCSNFAYNRDGHFNTWVGIKVSSHFTRKDARITHYGTDMCFDINGFPRPILPHKKRHLLWGRSITQTGQEVTFIKPEDYGLGSIREQINHTIDYCGVSPNVDNSRREKDIPEEIANMAYLLMKNLGQSSLVTQEIFRDEKIFEIICQIVTKTPDSQEYHYKSSNFMDISLMTYVVKTLINHEYTSTLIRENAKNLWEALKSRYDEKTLHLRTGNEVIFSDEDLIS